MRARGTFASPLAQTPGSPRAPFESAPSEGRGPVGRGQAVCPALTVRLPMIQRGGGGCGSRGEREIPPTLSRKRPVLGTQILQFCLLGKCARLKNGRAIVWPEANHNSSRSHKINSPFFLKKGAFSRAADTKGKGSGQKGRLRQKHPCTSGAYVRPTLGKPKSGSKSGPKPLVMLPLWVLF